MKKLLALLLALTMIAALAACGAKEEEKAPAEDQTPVTDTTTDDAPATMPEDDQPAAMPEDDQPAAMPEENEPAVMPEPEPEPEQPETPEVPEQKPEQPAQPSGDSVDLDAFYRALYDTIYPLDADGNGTGPFVDDMAVAPDMVETFYQGMGALNLKQLHIYFPMMSGVPYEVAVLEVASEADVAAAKAVLESRVALAVQDRFAYPMVTDAWTNNCEIAVCGNYLMMACGPDYQAHLDAFTAQFA